MDNSVGGAWQSGGALSNSDALVQTLRNMGAKVPVKAGLDLFQQGDPADALYVVDTGLLEISMLSQQGRRFTHLLLQPGAIFGEIALFDGGPRTATVTAKHDCVVWRVERRTLMDRIGRDADLAVGLIRLVISRMRWMNGEIDDQVFQPLEVRVARRLSFLARTIGVEGTIEISQGDLADHVGATREAVSKIVNDLRRHRIVELGRNRIVIRNLAALHRKGFPDPV